MHPYKTLDEISFWRTAVANRNFFDIDQLWQPQITIQQDDRIATFGSCFAQHFSRALIKNGFSWLCTEQAPAGLSAAERQKFQYEVFSCRTGNIYTTSLLRQWVEWALNIRKPPEEYWEKGGRIYDPFRPAIEPNGFASVEEMRLSRAQCIEGFRNVLISADIFVFTLGLTESWFNKPGEYEYPACPGTIAGEFNEKEHVFVNQTTAFIRQNLEEAISLIKAANPHIRFLLTVSPVPLTATNSGKHVLVATSYSKSVLRAVAGEVVEARNSHTQKNGYTAVDSVRNGNFHLGLAGWEPNGSVSVSKGNAILIDHDIENAFSGIKQKISMKPFNGRRLVYSIHGRSHGAGEVVVNLTKEKNSTRNGILLGGVDAANTTLTGEVDIPWEGDVYLWVGSRTKETKSEVHSVSLKLLNKHDWVRQDSKDIDYFPSYEIISAPPFKGTFFEPNLRSVNQVGVDFVMKSFFECLRNAGLEFEAPDVEVKSGKSEMDLICEEQILESFSS